jgi:hypothetical protein
MGAFQRIYFLYILLVREKNEISINTVHTHTHLNLIHLFSDCENQLRGKFNNKVVKLHKHTHT